MTKCLQSLKEMYQDLAMQQVYCSREAEFRQYSVLLRLNDGDILRSDAILQYVNDPSDFFLMETIQTYLMFLELFVK